MQFSMGEEAPPTSYRRGVRTECGEMAILYLWMGIYHFARVNYDGLLFPFLGSTSVDGQYLFFPMDQRVISISWRWQIHRIPARGNSSLQFKFPYLYIYISSQGPDACKMMDS